MLLKRRSNFFKYTPGFCLMIRVLQKTLLQLTNTNWQDPSLLLSGFISSFSFCLPLCPLPISDLSVSSSSSSSLPHWSLCHVLSQWSASDLTDGLSVSCIDHRALICCQSPVSWARSACRQRRLCVCVSVTSSFAIDLFFPRHDNEDGFKKGESFNIDAKLASESFTA